MDDNRSAPAAGTNYLVLCIPRYYSTKFTLVLSRVYSYAINYVCIYVCMDGIHMHTLRHDFQDIEGHYF